MLFWITVKNMSSKYGKSLQKMWKAAFYTAPDSQVLVNCITLLGSLSFVSNIAVTLVPWCVFVQRLVYFRYKPMSLSMSVLIYIVHKCETFNALYALVWSKHKRFQMLPKCISANSRITQVVRQRVPHRRTSHRILVNIFWYVVKQCGLYPSVFGT